ncbi:hypothetical protein FPV67DRAFT_760717 [Lyophyllum atratum]|nr:hypothetical protein FPV67DRAFT_760717 [Lyophyllum atratum]
MYSSTGYYLTAPINSVADLLSKDDQGFEDLLATAAENFPPDIKTEYRDTSPMFALSPFSSSSSSDSSSRPCTDADHDGEGDDFDFDLDSDVDELDLNHRPMSSSTDPHHKEEDNFDFDSASDVDQLDLNDRPIPSREFSGRAPSVASKDEQDVIDFDSDDVDQLDLNNRLISVGEHCQRAPSVPFEEQQGVPLGSAVATTTYTAKPSKLTRNSSSGHATSHRHDRPYARPHTASSSRRRLIRRLSHSSSIDSDYEPGDDSEGNATDDEYVPYAQLAPVVHRRASPAFSTSSERSTSTFELPTHQPATNPFAYKAVKKTRRAPVSRNQQSRSWDVEDLLENADKFNFVCPVCDRVQRNRRMPDLKRHLRTHGRPSSEDKTRGFWCKGVPLEDADTYGIPSVAERFLFLGEWRVGGCQKTFSRADALKRHLDNGNITCIRSRISHG